MDKAYFEKQYTKVTDILMNDFMSFWDEVSVDPVYGGYLCGFDREGKLFFEDKSVWQQGRSLWMFSKLYNEFGKKQHWLDCAKNGYDFMNKYCFAPNGHMYFRVTRDGKPLRERRYYFSEFFAIMGYCEYYKATGDEEVKERAINLYNLVEKYFRTPGYFPAKINPDARKYKGHSIYMIMVNTCQHLREIDDNPRYQSMIDECIGIITRDFVKEDKKALFETVNHDGSFIDTPEGRFLNPGHAIETSWFIMREAIHKKDRKLFETFIKVTEWSLERAWDPQYGGMFYFVDADNKPVISNEWDLKLFWVHCETMIAMVYSYMYTRDKKYLDKYEEILQYCIDHYADPGYPEWYGHLHRDGTPISQIKGSDWKGPYHNVRAFMILSQLFDDLRNDRYPEF